MSDATANLYEGLFLFNIQAISGNLNTAIEHVTEILTRANAELIAVSKWDERKLAYEIDGQKRGLYILAHFKVRGVQIANIERDINLSESLMRGMILRAEHIGEIELQQVLEEAAKTRDAIAVSSAGESKDEQPVAVAEETDNAEADADTAGSDNDSDDNA